MNQDPITEKHKPLLFVDFFFRKLAFLTSYVFSVSIFSTAVAGFFASLFALYYLDAVNVVVSETFMDILKVSIVVYWVLIMLQMGILHRLGFSGVGKHIRTMNRMIRTYPNIHISPNETDSDYKSLSRSLMFFPLFNAINLFTWILVLVLFLIGVSIFTEGFNLSIILSLVTMAIIVFFIAICFSYILSEALTGEMREECKRIMKEKNIPYVDRSTATVRIKLIFFLVLFIVNLFLSNSLTYYNRDEIFNVIHFSLIAIVISMFLAHIIFTLIYNALRQMEMAAYDLMRGGTGIVFPRSLDKEFINVARGINQASKRILDYQSSLEEKVELRTGELNDALKSLKQKEVELQMELDFAAEIQSGIIPSSLPNWNGLRFASFYQPMGKVSGDYLDVFEFNDHIFCLMADVSGHGVPAALITMSAKQAFSTIIDEDLKPAEIFRQVNATLVERIQTSDYLTCFLLKIDKKNNFLYGSAGHPKAIHLDAGRGEVSLLDTEGMFIGSLIEANEYYENGQSKLRSGDRIFLYTDGLIEHKNSRGEEFGLHRLIDLVKIYKNLSLNEAVDTIVSHLKEFMGTAPIRDDISILAIELEPVWSKFIEFYSRGIRSLKTRELESAVNYLKEAYHLIPDYADLRFQLARLHFYLKDFHTSEELIRIHLKNHREDIEAIQLAINIYSKLSRKDEIEHYMNLLKGLSPEHAKNFG